MIDTGEKTSADVDCTIGSYPLTSHASKPEERREGEEVCLSA